MPTARTRRKARKSDIAVENALVFLGRWDYVHPTPELAKILKASLPPWEEQYIEHPALLARHGSMITGWCRDLGVRLPRWLARFRNSKPWDRFDVVAQEEPAENVALPKGRGDVLM
jgi:hypothetical protein